MDEIRARLVVDVLRERGVNAHLAKAGVYQFGVRVALSDGREAVWDTDGTAGLEAQVMRDGMLVGFVPVIEGSETFDDQQVIDAHRADRLRPARGAATRNRASARRTLASSGRRLSPIPRRVPTQLTDRRGCEVGPTSATGCPSPARTGAPTRPAPVARYARPSSEAGVNRPR